MTLRISTPDDLREVTGADFTVSEQQWLAISADLEPSVVIAGAGSGKTELMSARVIYLVANGYVRPDQVLGLTFTTKATSELGARIRGSLARAGLDTVAVDDDGTTEVLEPTIATYNAYGASLLGEHGLRIGHEPGLRVMGDGARFQLASRVIAQHRREIVRLSDSPSHVIGWLLALDGAMAEHLVQPQDVLDLQAREQPRFQAVLDELAAQAQTKGKQDAIAGVLAKMREREELLHLVVDYRELKERYGLIDFSDQIARAHQLALQHPEVGRAERDKFRVVLLDEYQDTSVAQAKLLAGLFGAATDPAGLGHPVMAVGDPNQAIYGWRGASVSNIRSFRDQFRRADATAATRFALTTNRRSDARILELANRLAAPLYADTAMGVEELEAKPGAASGTIRTAVHRTTADELSWLAEQVQQAWARLHETERLRKPQDRRDSLWREIGVLVRTNKHAAQVYDALSAVDVPVEIVGLGGLLRLPEVAQVVATLSVLEDLTDNTSMLTLLCGPRWQIGARDLALLGARSREIAKAGRTDGVRSIEEQLEDSVAGADPAEIASLSDAVDDPGPGAYSSAARERLGRLSAELRMLRGSVGEPLLDLLRRIVDVTGIDVELASSLSRAAAARRENLDLFIKAVADFQAVDGQVTLPALNAWLETEDDYGGGLDLAPPTDSDTVKLLTVHRAKGLEYDVVFLVGVGDKKFPVETLRPQWTTQASVLPSQLRGDRDDVPQVRGYRAEDVKHFDTKKDPCPGTCLTEQAREHQALEELRLGYVAFTRARHEFVVSSHVWADTVKPIGPSPYQLIVREVMEKRWGLLPDCWHVPVEGEDNPNKVDPPSYPWPVVAASPEREGRVQAAHLVLAAMRSDALPIDEVSTDEQVQLDQWDTDLERLLAEAKEQTGTDIAVALPSSLSATALSYLRDDPEGFARNLARPMPRRPTPQARFGTRFHAWVESRLGQQQLLEPDELPGRADVGIEDESDLAELIATFESGPFAARAPHAVEAPFALVLAGQVVRGRIDAVYREDDGSFLVVDWKTSQTESADPLQLAIYRLAWAEIHDVPVESVRAAFHFVRTGHTVEPDALPGRVELEALVAD